jgi:hypothetical protein
MYISGEMTENVTGENYSLYIFISIKPRYVRWAGMQDAWRKPALHTKL